MTFSDGALLSGLILSATGFFRTLISLYEWYADKKLLITGLKAEALITEAVTYPADDSVNTGQYRFIAEFKAKDNITYYAKSRFASRSKEKYMNTAVTVVYDPDNPDKSRFERDISVIRDVNENIIILVIGTGLILFGFLHN